MLIWLLYWKGVLIAVLQKIIDAGIKADIHMVATELGFEKNGMAEVEWSDVEKVLTAIEQKINGV